MASTSIFDTNAKPFRHYEQWTVDMLSREHKTKIIQARKSAGFPCKIYEIEKTFSFPVQDRVFRVNWRMTEFKETEFVGFKIDFQLRKDGRALNCPGTPSPVVTFNLQNSEGKVVASSEVLEVTSKAEYRDFRTYLKMDDLKRLGLLVNDNLTIICDVKLMVSSTEGKPVEDGSKKKQNKKKISGEAKGKLRMNNAQYAQLLKMNTEPNRMFPVQAMIPARQGNPGYNVIVQVPGYTLPPFSPQNKV